MIQGIIYFVTWVTRPGACARCQTLDGKGWTVNELEEVPLIQEMNSHPNCHCEVDVTVDVDMEMLQVW